MFSICFPWQQWSTTSCFACTEDFLPMRWTSMILWVWIENRRFLLRVQFVTCFGRTRLTVTDLVSRPEEPGLFSVKIKLKSLIIWTKSRRFTEPISYFRKVSKTLTIRPYVLFLVLPIIVTDVTTKLRLFRYRRINRLIIYSSNKLIEEETMISLRGFSISICCFKNWY